MKKKDILQTILPGGEDPKDHDPCEPQDHWVHYQGGNCDGYDAHVKADDVDDD